MEFRLENICFSYSARPVLTDVSFSFGKGEIIALLGPNGVGKSTLMKCMLSLLRPEKGRLLIDGKDSAEMTRKELSRHVAYIPQSFSPTFNHTVLECVMMGKSGAMGLFGVPGKREEESALMCLERLGIPFLKDKGIQEISGGERQLVMIARALAQEAGIIVMDEPVSSLDYGNSFLVMETLESLRREGYTIVFSTHDPEGALRHATRVIALRDGRVVCDGKPSDVLSPELLSSLYSINVSFRNVEVKGRNYTLCIPTGHDSRDSAGCIVLNGERVLLITYGKSHTGFPKGHIEDGEDMEEAAIRETREETGVEAEIILHEPFSVPSARPGDRRSVHFFVARKKGGAERPGTGECDSVMWKSADEALSLLSFPEDRKLLGRVLERIRNSQDPD